MTEFRRVLFRSDYDATLDKALELADYAGFAARKAESEQHGRHRGIGLSTYVEVCGLAPSAVTAAIGVGAPGWEHSTVRLHPTGKATVITGTSPHGQGHATSWSQITQTELGIPFEDVEVIHGDTAFQPYGLGTYGSRSLAVGGVALYRSLGKVREKAREVAAHLLECSIDDLEWTGTAWQVKGSPDRSKTIQELAGAAWAASSMPEGIEQNPIYGKQRLAQPTQGGAPTSHLTDAGFDEQPHTFEYDPKFRSTSDIAKGALARGWEGLKGDYLELIPAMAASAFGKDEYATEIGRAHV